MQELPASVCSPSSRLLEILELQNSIELLVFQFLLDAKASAYGLWAAICTA